MKNYATRITTTLKSFFIEIRLLDEEREKRRSRLISVAVKEGIPKFRIKSEIDWKCRTITLVKLVIYIFDFG